MFQRDKCKATLDSEKVFLFNAMEPSSKKRKLSREWLQEALQDAQVDDNTKIAVLDAVVQLPEDSMLEASFLHWDFLFQNIVRDETARRALIITHSAVFPSNTSSSAFNPSPPSLGFFLPYFRSLPFFSCWFVDCRVGFSLRCFFRLVGCLFP